MADKRVDQAVLDTLKEVMGGDYPELLETFLCDSNERLSQLQRAGEASELVEAAHSFKGSCSNMGATRLADLCHQLEQRSQVESTTDLAGLVEEIANEFALIKPVYESERRQSMAELSTVRRL